MWYWIFRVGFSIFFKLFFKFTVEGLENIPKKTNFIIVANHASWIDPILIMVAIPRKIYCIASRSLYKIWWLAWFLKKTEAFPTGHSSGKGVDLLTENKIVGLFPEGGCSRDGKLKAFRRGMAFLAVKTGRPVLPCAIIGSRQALPREARFPKLFLPLRVKIAKPIFMIKEFDLTMSDVYLQEGTLKIRNVIKEMLCA